MNSKVDLQKPFTEMCVIAEDKKTHQGAIKWHIPELELRKYLEKYSQGYYIDSSTFSIGTPSYCSFYFRVFPVKAETFHMTSHTSYKITDTYYTDQVSVSIIFNRNLPNCAWIKGEIYFDGIDNRKAFSVSAKGFDKKVNFYEVCRNSDLHRLLYSTNGCSIHCSIKIIERELKCTFDKEYISFAESRNYFSNKETLKRETFTDISITVNGHLFKTHRALLAHIPYFQELFEDKEPEQHFELTDIDNEIFEHILTFLYSGDIPQLHFQLACELYIAASDLKVFDLKRLCSAYLGVNLTEMNVVLVLKLAHAYEDIALKRECFKFIKESDIEILSQKSIIL